MGFSRETSFTRRRKLFLSLFLRFARLTPPRTPGDPYGRQRSARSSGGRGKGGWPRPSALRPKACFDGPARPARPFPLKTRVGVSVLSDSHIGFTKAAEQGCGGHAPERRGQDQRPAAAPAFLLHTGDLTHLSKPEEFDTVAEILKGAKAGKIFFVPGEHDVFTDNGKRSWSATARGRRGSAGTASTTRACILSAWSM